MKQTLIPAIAALFFYACGDSSQPINTPDMNNTITVADYASDTALELETRHFLKALNSG